MGHKGSMAYKNKAAAYMMDGAAKDQSAVFQTAPGFEARVGTPPKEERNATGMRKQVENYPRPMPADAPKQFTQQAYKRLGKSYTNEGNVGIPTDEYVQNKYEEYRDGPPLLNLNKGYGYESTGQEESNLMNDNPIASIGSGGTFMTPHSQSRIGGSPLMASKAQMETFDKDGDGKPFEKEDMSKLRSK